MRLARSRLRGLVTLGLLTALVSAPAPAAELGTRSGPNPAVGSVAAAPSLEAEPSSLAALAPPLRATAKIGVETLGSGPALAPPVQPSIAPAYRSALVADHCLDRDLPTPPTADAVYTVLDRSYALPAQFVPGDLVSAGGAGFAPDQLVRAVLLDDLRALREAAGAAGHELIVESAYRSYPAQAATFDQFVATYGYAEALVRAARPGHSEHQLGTALDFSSAGWQGRVGDWAAESAAGAWMAEHASEFGFVMSYPSGSQPATCFTYEPWHYRWIGRSAAAAQRTSGEPPRTFLLRYLDG